MSHPGGSHWYDPIVSAAKGVSAIKDAFVDTGIPTAAMGAAGLYGINRAYDRLGDVGEQALAGVDPIADAALTQTEFQPFTVKVGSSLPGSAYSSSNISVDALGNIDLDLSEQEQRIKRGLLEKARTRAVVQDPTGAPLMQQYGVDALKTGRSFLTGLDDSLDSRQQNVYDAIRAMQIPEEERQQLALEERLLSQGRLGVNTAMYGGTPEQLALSKAQAEAQNQAALMAMQQAQQDRSQQAALAQQTLGMGQGLLSGRLGLQGAQQNLGLQALASAYMPQAQALNMLQQGLGAAQLQQRGQLYGAGLFGEAKMSGLDALLSSALGQANLMGAAGTGLLSGALG